MASLRKGVIMTKITVHHEKAVTPNDEAVFCMKMDTMNGRTHVTVDRDNKAVTFEYGVPDFGVSEVFFLMGVVGALMDEFYIKKLEVTYEEGC